MESTKPNPTNKEFINNILTFYYAALHRDYLQEHFLYPYLNHKKYKKNPEGLINVFLLNAVNTIKLFTHMRPGYKRYFNPNQDPNLHKIYLAIKKRADKVIENHNYKDNINPIYFTSDDSRTYTFNLNFSPLQLYKEIKSAVDKLSEKYI